MPCVTSIGQRICAGLVAPEGVETSRPAYSAHHQTTKFIVNLNCTIGLKVIAIVVPTAGVGLGFVHTEQGFKREFPTPQLARL